MNVVIKVNDEIKEKMIEYYKDKTRDKVIPYVVFQAQDEDTVITMYESGKVMFQGTSADVDAAMWGVALENTSEKKEEKKKINKMYYNASAVGSDEVGTGDYFGPIVVTACFVDKNNLEELEKLGVGDSKKIDDSKILKIAPEIAKIVKYKSVILTNLEYNEKYTKDINMNKIKAILHNKVLYQLVEEEKPKYDYIIVDEFARENRYYEYLKRAITLSISLALEQQKENYRDLHYLLDEEVLACELLVKEFDYLVNKKDYINAFTSFGKQLPP